MKRILSIALALSVMAASGCGGSKTSRYQAQFLELFDTVTTIVGYAESEAQFREISEQIYDQLEEYHQLYDIYNDYEGVTNLKTINDSAGIAPVAVDGRIIDLLLFAREIYGQTGGTVNAAMGAVLSIWHDYRQAGTEDPAAAQLPPMELLREAQKHTDMDVVLIDREANTVYLPDANMKLDVGAMAKGYAVERVARELESQGISSLLLSVGGNVRAIGGKIPDEKNRESRWTIGVQNPDKSAGRPELFSLGIQDLSVVSSGISERYYTVEGVRYHHIIDPVTLMPSGNHAQVTVLCPDSGLADALSTCLFNLSIEEGASLIEGMEGVEACWVAGDGSIRYSGGFQEYIKAEERGF